MNAPLIGQSVLRKEDHRFLTGKGNYTDDINLPKQTYAYFVRSPYAHARLGKIDKRAALAVPGVHAVITFADLPEVLQRNTLPLLVPHPSIKQPRLYHMLAKDEEIRVREPLPSSVRNTAQVPKRNSRE